MTARIILPPGGSSSVSPITRIAGNSGAAGADITWQYLTANAAANATTTLQTVMTTTGVGVGVWLFSYAIIYQSTATAAGVDFAVNHTGTVTDIVLTSRLTTTGGAAANGVGDQVTTNTANLLEGKSQRAINAKIGATLGVDTANANMLVVIDGIIVVTVSGDLELMHCSEVATSTQVRANTVLELRKVA